MIERTFVVTTDSSGSTGDPQHPRWETGGGVCWRKERNKVGRLKVMVVRGVVCRCPSAVRITVQCHPVVVEGRIQLYEDVLSLLFVSDRQIGYCELTVVVAGLDPGISCGGPCDAQLKAVEGKQRSRRDS